MRVLVLGGGAREHALCWSLSRGASVEFVACAPGNAGVAGVAALRPVDPTDAASVTRVVAEDAIDLVVVGPEAPLVAGIADVVRDVGAAVFGPSAAAARIEGSKAFAKEIMTAAGVPTAGYWAGSDPDEARRALERFAPPYVVKADGLAAGKGVRICTDLGEAERAVRDALVERAFGDAGDTLVIEEYLHGPEVSLFALADGTSVVPLAPAQDYKRALDGDQGPNTGGMGAYSPVPAVDGPLVQEIRDRVLAPTVAELADRGSSFVGLLYAGLVLTADGPRVLEFNARFGDPETQVVLPRLRTDLGALLAACAHGELGQVASARDVLEWDERPAVTVVLASGGYPGPYESGKPIKGLDAAAEVPDTEVFHAGTRREDGEIVTAGGRVLSVTGVGATLAEARARAYEAADAITFDGLHRREDIAAQPTGG